ncbi:MAG: hypothetical protein OXK73_04440, partial [Rhodospirillaceae bacterium]|nr:hypothetical protein [Rhodospirillaceae bacterium]
PNAVLPSHVTPQHFQPVTPEGGKVLECPGGVQQGQAPCCLIGETLKGSDPITLEETPRVSPPETLNHLGER